MLSLHAFRLLFLRSRVRKEKKWLILILGWSFITSVVTIGPLAIQRKSLGPYFGPSGFWYAHIVHSSALPIPLKVLDYTAVPCLSDMSGIHDGKCLALRETDAPILTACLDRIQEWMSAFSSFMLYVAVLLRVRGNLIQDTAGKWSLRWISRSESWQLGFARDYLDSCLVKMVAIIVWCA
jgi:hypothetical protein